MAFKVRKLLNMAKSGWFTLYSCASQMPRCYHTDYTEKCCIKKIRRIKFPTWNWVDVSPRWEMSTFPTRISTHWKLKILLLYLIDRTKYKFRVWIPKLISVSFGFVFSYGQTSKSISYSVKLAESSPKCPILRKTNWKCPQLQWRLGH